MCTHMVRDGCERYGGRKACILADQPRRHEPSIAAARDPEVPWIGDAQSHEMIETGEIVVCIGSAHIAQNVPRKSLPACRAPARIGKEHGATACEQHQHMDGGTSEPAWTPVPYGTAMDIHDEGMRPPSSRPQH